MEFCRLIASEYGNEKVPIYYKAVVDREVRGEEDFPELVEEILSDERGWKNAYKNLDFVRLKPSQKILKEMLRCPMEFEGGDDLYGGEGGYFFRRVNNKPAWAPRLLEIALCTPGRVAKECGMVGMSCYSPIENKIFINTDNWNCISKACENASGGSKTPTQKEDYRKYVIYHEVGHALGFEHVRCERVMEEFGGEAPLVPIMEQQTLGIKKCRPNKFPIKAMEELGIPRIRGTRVGGSSSSATRKDNTDFTSE